MHLSAVPLKPLSSITLSADEQKIIAWFKKAAWEAQTGASEPIPYKAKVPEFFNGVRFYRTQAAGGASATSQGALELFIKKLQYQGVISKQEMYPLTGHGAARFLALKKADLDNLGVGQPEEDEE